MTTPADLLAALDALAGVDRHAARPEVCEETVLRRCVLDHHVSAGGFLHLRVLQFLPRGTILFTVLWTGLSLSSAESYLLIVSYVVFVVWVVLETISQIIDVLPNG